MVRKNYLLYTLDDIRTYRDMLQPTYFALIRWYTNTVKKPSLSTWIRSVGTGYLSTSTPCTSKS